MTLNFRNATAQKWAIALFGGLVVGPLLMLSLFNHPSPADDFCFAFMTRDHGFWHSVNAYYTGWTGRYVAILLFHGAPLFLGWFAYSKVLPIAVILLLLVSVARLVNTLFPDESRGYSYRLALVFISLYILGTVSLAETFFWSGGLYVYVLPGILLVLLLSTLIRFYRYGGRGRLIGAALLTFAIVGCGEMLMLAVVYMLGLLLAYRWFWQRKQDWALVLLSIVAAGSVYLELSAPGNAVRIGSNPEGRQLVAALVACFKLMLRQSWAWLDLALILSAGLLALGLYQRKLSASVLQVNPLIAGSGWIFLLAFLFLPHFYGVGVHVSPPDRILDSVRFFFLLGWFYNVAVGVAWLSRRTAAPPALVPATQKTWWILALILGVYSTKYSAIRLVYKDLLSGTAYRYDRELYARYEHIASAAGDTVRITPLKNVPVSLFVEDVKTNPQHLWNRCQSDYFHRKTVILIQNSTP